MAKKIHIIKASGEKQEFSEEKLRDSLRLSGASEKLVDVVLYKIKKDLKTGFTTKKIYKKAFSLIKKDRVVAIRYSLRRAVMELGPTGFPFEKFLGEIMKTEGYDVKVGVVLRGFCVTHEVDVLASKEGKHVFVEAKFHNEPGIKTDLKVALYVKARVDDLKAVHKLKEVSAQPIIHEGWLVTNTKLTSKARDYGNCAGLKVIGWNHPQKGNLHDMILKSKVHPLSCLTTLSNNNKKLIYDKGVVLCKDLVRKINLLKEIGMDKKSIDNVVDEIGLLCDSGIYESVD